MKALNYTLKIFFVFGSLCVHIPSFTFANNTYSIDEQIRIAEDKDYAQYLKEIEKKKALKEKARQEQKLMREQQRLAQEKARKEQVRIRQQARVQTADENQQYFQEQIQRKKTQQIQQNIKYTAEKKLEKRLIMEQQKINRERFYRTNPTSKQASPRVDRSKRKFL